MLKLDRCESCTDRRREFWDIVAQCTDRMERGRHRARRRAEAPSQFNRWVTFARRLQNALLSRRQRRRLFGPARGVDKITPILAPRFGFERAHRVAFAMAGARPETGSAATSRAIVAVTLARWALKSVTIGLIAAT